MKEETFLTCISQIGIAVAGFTGLVTAFRDQSKIWELTEKKGLHLILEYSIAITISSLLCFPLFEMMSNEVVVWKFSSAFLGTFLVVECIKNLNAMRQLSQKKLRPRQKTNFIIFVLGLPVITGVSNLINICYGADSIYFIGLIIALTTTLMQLRTFLLSSPSNSLIKTEKLGDEINSKK